MGVYYQTKSMDIPWECLCCAFALVPLIDIESLHNRLLKFCYVPTTSAVRNSLLFFVLLLSFTVLMKQTRQALCVIKQSIFRLSKSMVPLVVPVCLHWPLAQQYSADWASCTGQLSAYLSFFLLMNNTHKQSNSRCKNASFCSFQPLPS
jgi:hypothetical protein